MNIYVGNLPFSVSDEDLNRLFAQYGEVTTARVVRDPQGRSKGFGFVEMDDAGAAQAIQALNETDVQGRTVVVNQARPKEDKPRSFNPRPDRGPRR